MMTFMLLASAVVAFAVSIMFLGMFLKRVASIIPHVADINHRVCLSK